MATHTTPHTPELAPEDVREEREALGRLSNATGERERSEARFADAAGGPEALDAHIEMLEAREEVTARERWIGWMRRESERRPPAPAEAAEAGLDPGPEPAVQRQERLVRRVRGLVARTGGRRPAPAAKPPGPDAARARGNGDVEAGAAEASAEKLGRIL